MNSSSILHLIRQRHGGSRSEYGRFAWSMDPEGNRIELWEPQKKSGATGAG